MEFRFGVFVCLAAGAIFFAPQLPSQTAGAGKKEKGGIVEIGPAKDLVLPEPSNPPPQGKRPKVIGWPAGQTPTAPPGFRVTQFADNLQGPRWIYVLPNGDVLVSEASGGENTPQRITLFRNVGQDGTPKVREVFLSGLKRPHGMLLLGNRFYVANTDRLMVFPYQTGQTQITAPGEKIADLPDGGVHTSRTLVANADGSKLYLGVGSSSDFDEGGASLHEPHRAAILEVNPKSILAGIALGEAREAQGDLEGALEVFQRALTEYNRQYPKSYEPPTLLLSRIVDIQEAMAGAKPATAPPYESR